MGAEFKKFPLFLAWVFEKVEMFYMKYKRVGIGMGVGMMGSILDSCPQNI